MNRLYVASGALTIVAAGLMVAKLTGASDALAGGGLSADWTSDTDGDVITTAFTASMTEDGGTDSGLPKLSATEIQNLIQECDRLAAHPEDFYRHAVSVSDEDIVPVLASQACKAAADYAQEPHVYRMRFQYGRAQRLLGEHEQAFNAIISAALGNPNSGEDAVPLAFKYLGDMYVEGFTPEGQSLPDAISYYEMAIGNGVVSAEQPLEDLKAFIEKNTFDANKFNQPRFMNILYTGDFSQLKQADYHGFSMYLSAFVTEYMKNDANSQDQDPYCKPLLDYYGVKFAGLNQTLGGFNHMFAAFEEGRSNGAVSGVLKYIVSGFEAQEAQLNGNQDAWTLMTSYGCKDSEITKTIFSNAMKSQDILVKQFQDGMEAVSSLTGYNFQQP